MHQLDAGWRVATSALWVRAQQELAFKKRFRPSASLSTSFVCRPRLTRLARTTSRKPNLWLEMRWDFADSSGFDSSYSWIMICEEKLLHSTGVQGPMKLRKTFDFQICFTKSIPTFPENRINQPSIEEEMHKISAETEAVSMPPGHPYAMATLSPWATPRHRNQRHLLRRKPPSGRSCCGRWRSWPKWWCIWRPKTRRAKSNMKRWKRSWRRKWPLAFSKKEKRVIWEGSHVVLILEQRLLFQGSLLLAFMINLMQISRIF